jgi:exoribonuclease-2
LEPARHSGLGIAAYTQSTSPIRRYVDLIAQRQLLSHLSRTEGAYALEQLEPLMQRLERTTTQAEQLERERKQYWTLRYLEQRRWAELDAVVLQNFPDKHWVQLIPVAYECESPQVRGRPMPPGTRFKARIEMVWPREGTVRVTPILDDED